MERVSQPVQLAFSLANDYEKSITTEVIRCGTERKRGD